MRYSGPDRWLREALARGASCLVIAAHPDDELVGAASVLARGCSRRVLFLTDGAPRNPALWSPSAGGTRRTYAQLRRSEAIAALGQLGVRQGAVRFLDIPDQEAVLHLGDLAREVASHIAINAPAMLVTHPYEGGHPDHDACAAAVHLALRLMRTRSAAPLPALVEMTSYHAGDDGTLRTGEFLPSTAPICTVELDDSMRERKRRALAAYRSQTAMLEQFAEGIERFRRAPWYDFSRPPHGGQLYYERMGWADGHDWRRAASCATVELRLEQAAWL